MSVRSMLMMSNGALKRSTLQTLMRMINGKSLKGFLALVKSLLVKWWLYRPIFEMSSKQTPP